jgi:Sulfotransferase family
MNLGRGAFQQSGAGSWRRYLASAIAAGIVDPSNERTAMFLHPHLRDARPLMVVGRPRCGTRFVASALGRHRAILLLGEIPALAMDNAIRFLSGTADVFASEPRWTGWENSRRNLLYAIWASILKGVPRESRRTIRWFGHKTPGHDEYWEFYRDFFGDSAPRYVFCMRNFVDHYLSFNSLKEHRSAVPVDRTRNIHVIARDYRASVARYADMKAALKDDVSLFILDDLREGGIDYVRETVFERLGIEVDNRTLSRIDVSRRPNSTEGAGAARRTELSADEHRFLEKNQDLLEALDAVRRARPLGPSQAAEPRRSRLGSLGSVVFGDRAG